MNLTDYLTVVKEHSLHIHEGIVQINYNRQREKTPLYSMDGRIEGFAPSRYEDITLEVTMTIGTMKEDYWKYMDESGRIFFHWYSNGNVTIEAIGIRSVTVDMIAGNTLVLIIKPCDMKIYREQEEPKWEVVSMTETLPENVVTERMFTFAARRI